MVTIEGSTVIARTAEDVFDFVADERNEPSYNSHMTRVEQVTPGPVGKGTRWSATVESRGKPLDMTIEVTDHVRPCRLGTTTSMSAAVITGALTFEPDPGGTRLSWRWQMQPKGMLKVMRPVIAFVGRRQEAEIWASLKSHLEADAPPAAEQ